MNVRQCDWTAIDGPRCLGPWGHSGVHSTSDRFWEGKGGAFDCYARRFPMHGYGPCGCRPYQGITCAHGFTGQAEAP